MNFINTSSEKKQVLKDISVRDLYVGRRITGPEWVRANINLTFIDNDGLNFTQTGEYERLGNLIVLKIPNILYTNNGSGVASNIRCALPEELRPVGQTQNMMILRIENGGVSESQSGLLKINGSSGFIEFYRDGSEALWANTDSLTQGFFSTTVTYFLF